MTMIPHCPRCGQPLAIIEDEDSHETYCPDCTSFRPNRPTFENWMARVDDVLVRKVGVSSADLPDMAYADMYDEGITPEEAADRAIEDSMI